MRCELLLFTCSLFCDRNPRDIHGKGEETGAGVAL